MTKGGPPDNPAYQHFFSFFFLRAVPSAQPYRAFLSIVGAKEDQTSSV